MIDEFTQFELIEFIWKGVNNLMMKYGESLAEDEIIKSDLTYSIQEFKKQFNLAQTYAIVWWTRLVRDTENIVTTFAVAQSVTAPYKKFSTVIFFYEN